MQNAVDTKRISELRSLLTEEDLGQLRRELGIGRGPVAIALGSIYPRKRPDYLVEAADTIRAAIPTFELLVIGDGPDRPVIDRAAATRSWIHPVGPLTGPDMVRHAALGSVMLNPGLVGLAVLDAFALGLPVATCDLPFHSPEIEYLVDDVNGTILAEGTSPQAFGNYVARILCDSETVERLRIGAVHTFRTLTIEEMVHRFTTGIVDALGRTD